MGALLERLRRRARADGCAYAPMGLNEVRRAEERLGFVLPRVMVEVYTRVANGGFGPGYGLIGLVGGAPLNTGDSVVSLYASLRSPDPDDPTWEWPDRLLAICHWGCSIYSCVDCSTDDGKMVSFDPNGRGAGDWDDAWIPESLTIAECLETWLDKGLGQPGCRLAVDDIAVVTAPRKVNFERAQSLGRRCLIASIAGWVANAVCTVSRQMRHSACSCN